MPCWRQVVALHADHHHIYKGLFLCFLGFGANTEFRRMINDSHRVPKFGIVGCVTKQYPHARQVSRAGVRIRQFGHHRSPRNVPSVPAFPSIGPPTSHVARPLDQWLGQHLPDTQLLRRLDFADLVRASSRRGHNPSGRPLAVISCRILRPAGTHSAYHHRFGKAQRRPWRE